MRGTKKAAALLILALAGTGGFAQSNTASHRVTLRVVGVAALALTDTSPITLNLFVPADGSAPRGETDSGKGLKYTVINSPGSNSRIQVSISGTLPEGTALRVEAIGGRPEVGTAVLGGVALSHVEQDLITNIPSCYTDRLAPDGVALRYSFEATDASRLEIDTGTEVTIRYTITDG